ncbi:MAG: FtsH protease activity modulator HflK [Ahrensia sp.]|nr:FtsH protease activity modulator HflK [Ahrensia sp.]
MPWSNQTGGGRSNGSSNGGGGPWGQPPRGPQRPSGGGGGGGGGGPQPPDLEELLRRGQDSIKKVIPGGGSGGIGGGFSPIAWGFIALAAIGVYFYASAYQVDANEVGIELVFGEPKQDVSQPGLHFAFWPFETVEKVQIVERQAQIGSTGRGGSREGLMLSGDQNIVDVSFSILYSVDNINDFLFNVREPTDMVAEVGESAMREVVGRRPAQDIFRDDRSGIESEVLQITQATLNEYGAGIAIRAISIEDAAPPAEVADAFEEVQRAEQDEDRLQEEANRDRNRILGAARGEAAQIREDAAAYKNRVVQEAEGEAQRFLSVYEEYAKAPEVTRKRLFLETMEQVLADSNKVIVEQGSNGQGVVPYLPLTEIQRRQTSGNTNTTNGN